jgi:hypothetical protein
MRPLVFFARYTIKAPGTYWIMLEGTTTTQAGNFEFFFG